MGDTNTDVIQGTLDMLILKTLSLQPLHGFGIARRIEQISRGFSSSKSIRARPHGAQAAGTRWMALTPSGGRSENSRRAKYYNLTRAGRKQLESDMTLDSGHGGLLRSRGSSTPKADGCPSGARWTHGLGRLSHRTRADQDDADEVQHYFDAAAASYIARGLPASDARRAAHAGAGNLTTVREAMHGYGWGNGIDTVAGDVRYALRRLRRSAGFTITTVLTLAIGIGATTAIFSVVNPILLEPLPYASADRLVMLSDRGADGQRIGATFGTYRELVARTHSFSALAVAKPWQPTITGRADPERPDGQRVSAGFLRVLGAEPLIGRDFDAADDRPQGANVVIVSDGFWRRYFGGDRDVIGRQVTLDGEAYTIIGVMPPGFTSVLAPTAELWSLLQYAVSLPTFRDPARHESREWGHRSHPGGTAAAGGERRSGQSRHRAGRAPRGFGFPPARLGVACWRADRASPATGRNQRGEAPVARDGWSGSARPDDRVRERDEPAARPLRAAPG